MSNDTVDTTPSNLAMLTRMIAELPEEDQAEVNRCAIKLRSMCEQHPDAAPVALALVAAEMDEGVAHA